MGVEEGLDGGAGELEDELDEEDEDEKFHGPVGGDEAVTELVPGASGHEVEGVDDGEHDAPGAATLQEDAHIGPLKVGDNVGDDLSGSLECGGAEEYPKECHKSEGDEPGNKTSEMRAGYLVKPRFA